MLDINKIKKENLINTKENKNELLEYLKLNFPQTIKDGQVDLKAIAMLLGLNNKEIRGYELSFTGKALANALYDTPNTKELKFHKSLSKNFETTKNAIIKGDNLHALKLLKSAYYEKIKMIYIDPPYNTKNDKFIYNDDFVKEHKKLLIEVGLLEITEEGEEIRSEILNFFINAKGDRSHSAWLGFMLPRLKLARDLLREDGVIFISIDDNEQANLKILCDEIFGEENFVANIVWHKKDNASFLGKNIVDLIEYILIYRKSETFEGTRDALIDPKGHRELIIKSSNVSERILDKNFCIFENGKFNGLLKRGEYGSKQFNIEILKDVEITNGIAKDDIQIKGRFCWSQQKIDDEIKQGGKIEIKSIKGMKPIFYKNFGKDIPFRPMRNLLSKKIEEDVYTNNDAAEEIKKIFELPIFNYSKPSKLIKKFIKNVTKNNDIILDFFAGSGTTAQAVMELNAEDNGNRKFILVQLDEKIDENKSKIAYDFCKNELGSENPVISDITIERVKRAGEKILKENVDKNLDLDFKVFSLVEKPELTKNELNTLNLKYHEHLTPYEKALNLALLDGKTLDKDLKMILKDKLYGCENCFYMLNCDDEVLEFLRKTQNENVYINGYDDINLEDYLNLESFLKERLKVVY
ncbi:site-specific DNA-methyltransferase [Campylobacter jejuni]|uniref:site-specific DNA-methyltransferase n=1 Tax=Campylobacter jejuni TaxID=197 RepID=UPI00069B07C3|nr:site-specific DNA-methyltransferase [Campylobacter jejuni]EAH4933246.1 site-specific DNA-methyltransferase [Campylobacter jejuni]EAI2669262.1 site-specific DNA-methyltransferase [Campylobacter jejuni]EAK4542691.1 site-specific DNA-methyltransferase [Campylobacter jejuni]EAL1700992.1 site-specific DNA-methyltransferase [Campylobacter jejuni]EAL1701259.1 site-specific DNA-methyltransferase [Campylobacter jejuni]